MPPLRRHPLAGLTLLAALFPLLSAGPGVLCGATEVDHHVTGSHARSTHADAHDLPTAVAGGEPVVRAHHGPPAETVVRAPDGAPQSPSSVCCPLGMLCSGTGLTSPGAAGTEVRTLHVLAAAEPLWALHDPILSLPERPPRA